MEAIVFGFLAYFGAEVAEFAHKKYDQYRKCETCEENKDPQGEIKIHQGDYIIVDHKLGEGNE